MKIKPEDKWFSLCIRERAEWTCERCGVYYPEGERRGLHCSHFVGRANKSVRWSAINAAAHCFGCHARLEGDPTEFDRWIREYLERHYDVTTYDLLMELKQKIARVTKKDKEAIADHYREQYAAMAQRRTDGEMGRIEFEGWL